jgi:uncharacterized RDD family membrane protein YckC
MEPATPSSVAARVAQRYAKVPSWREAMAAEAAARAAAEAMKTAPPAPKARIPEAAPSAPPAPVQQSLETQILETPAPARRVKASPVHHEPEPDPQPYQPELIRYSVCADSLPAPRYAPAEARVPTQTRANAASFLEDPMEEALVEPTSPLPARVIEFPRELVAPRKARPRLALGPLLEEERLDVQSPAPQAALFDSGELRILEADPEPAPGRVAHAAMNVPEWHSIHLDNEEPMRQPQAAAPIAFAADLPLHVAPIQDRVMSGVVDMALTLVAFLAFVLVFAVCTTHPPTGKVALAGAGATLLAMWVLYQFIFFSLSAATPGMRYAKIALCTFDDENPTHGVMRGRIAALLLSALPLGLGFIWAIFDEDGLGWHDRITQTYQRSYRGM